jgi:preprotein translocase subunit SecE
MSAQKRSSAGGSAVETAAPASAERRARSAKPKPTESKEPSGFHLLIQRLKTTYYDTASEMRKITWPDSETTRNLTIVVIGISLFMGLLLGAVDWILVKLLGLF